MEVFPISSDETNKIYELLMLSFSGWPSRQQEKVKSPHHRSPHNKAYLSSTEGSHTNTFTQPPPSPEPLQQPAPTPPHPLLPTPPCPETPPDTSKTCKICHNDITERWWIKCDQCDQWMHPKFIGMLVKDFKVL